MANVVILRHPTTGLTKKGFYGFSWTMLFFSWFANFIRGDWQTGVIALALSIGLTFLLPGLALVVMVWAFFWNKNYTTRLLEKGYVFDDQPEVVRAASLSLGVPTKSYVADAASAAA